MKPPYWSGSFLPYPFSLIGSFPSAFPPQTPLCNFSPEVADNTFLRNIGIDLWNHMELKSKTTPASY
jgi:hypothetical protein